MMQRGKASGLSLEERAEPDGGGGVRLISVRVMVKPR